MGLNYLLARNQCINNSPGIFSCIRAGVNTGATCIRTDKNSLKNLASMRKIIPQTYFPVFARVRLQTPHVFVQKLVPQKCFPACIGFVPGVGGSWGARRPQQVSKAFLEALESFWNILAIEGTCSESRSFPTIPALTTP